MVGRLVEHEQVGARGDEQGEREPPALAAREHRNLLLVRLPAGEEEPAEQRLRLRALEAGCLGRAHSSTVPAFGSSCSCCEKYAGTTPCPMRTCPPSSSRSAEERSRAASSSRSRSGRRARHARRARARARRLSSRSCLSPADDGTSSASSTIRPRPGGLQELEAERAAALRQGRSARPAACLRFFSSRADLRSAWPGPASPSTSCSGTARRTARAARCRR